MEYTTMFFAISLGTFLLLRSIEMIVDLTDMFNTRGNRYRNLRKYCILYSAETYDGDVLPFEDASIYSYDNLRNPNSFETIEKDLRKYHGYRSVSIQDVFEI